MDLKVNSEKNKKQILVLMGLVALIGLVLYFSFILRPQVMRVRARLIEINKTGLELKNAQADITMIDKLKMEMSSYKAKVERYEKMLPAEEELPNLLEELSKMAKNSGVKIVGITPTMSKKEPKAKGQQIYQERPILISAKSGYHELGRFLSNLENSDRFMKVADIEIKANKSMPKKHDVELLVLTYILLKGK